MGSYLAYKDAIERRVRRRCDSPWRLATGWRPRWRDAEARKQVGLASILLSPAVTTGGSHEGRDSTEYPCATGTAHVALFNEHMAIGDLAEPLGFDSLFALEHHFTGYSMSPSPLQLLSYYAGRTKRSPWGPVSSCCPGTTRSGWPSRSHCSTSLAAGAP